MRKITLTYKGITFKYAGGDYIDVGEYLSVNCDGSPYDFRAFDAINVCDRNGNPTVATFHDVKSCAEEWYTDNIAFIRDFRMTIGN